MQNKKMNMTGEPNKVLVEMDTQDAEDFILFSQHRAKFDALLHAGVFDVRNGSATLNFNHQGTLMLISITITPYKRQKEENAV